MRIERQIYRNAQWENIDNGIKSEDIDLVTVFGNTDELEDKHHYAYLKKQYPNASIIGCSSSGNILDNSVSENSIVATAVSFDSANVVLHSVKVDANDDVSEKTKELADKFDKEGLKHIFVLADGLHINGSKIVKTFNQSVEISKSGGLAGDGDRFKKTLVISDDNGEEKIIAALGFYGDALTINSGYSAGWSEFGARRTITKSVENVLYEIDGEPALDFYKKYLGEYAAELPNSGLRFPLGIKENDNEPEVIRTLLGIDEEKKTITFAGDIPEGYKARLMKADVVSLIEGASEAAKIVNNDNKKDALCLVVSCVGRKIVMNQLIDDELEAVSNILGENVVLAGFYSYGEISPHGSDILNCSLHNQTMTLTLIYEN